jgi:hypothetical protein
MGFDSLFRFWILIALGPEGFFSHSARFPSPATDLFSRPARAGATPCREGFGGHCAPSGSTWRHPTCRFGGRGGVPEGNGKRWKFPSGIRLLPPQVAKSTSRQVANARLRVAALPPATAAPAPAGRQPRIPARTKPGLPHASQCPTGGDTLAGGFRRALASPSVSIAVGSHRMPSIAIGFSRGGLPEGTGKRRFHLPATAPAVASDCFRRPSTAFDGNRCREAPRNGVSRGPCASTARSNRSAWKKIFSLHWREAPSPRVAPAKGHFRGQRPQ